MDEEDPELLRLLKFELWAFRRCERLRGYPQKFRRRPLP
jgi:hypothetical protein